MVGEKKWAPYVMLIPWGIGFLIYKIYAFISVIVLSFISDTEKKFSLINYIDLFTEKNLGTTVKVEFLNSIKVTLLYAFITVPLVLIVSLAIAYVLSRKIRGIGVFRTIYYIPTILGANVAVAILWSYLFEPDGLINSIFGTSIPFLGTGWGAMTAIISLRIWQFGSTMIIFLNALKGVPESLYEAATIDGASKWKQFVKITIPIISPMILFNAVMRIVEMFQVFNGPRLITQGGPEKKTNVINLLIYTKAFEEVDQYNLAAAMSVILFIILISFTLIVFRSSKYWVHYEEE